MRTLRILLFLLICVPYISLSASSKLVTLDKYIIPVNVKGAVIGKVVIEGNDKVTLEKDTSNLFLIDQSGYIKLKPTVALSASSPIKYEIILKSWPTGDVEKKIDVHQQVMMNIDIIAEIFMNEVND